MTRRDRIITTLVSLVVMALGVSILVERRPVQTAEQAVAHEQTVQSETVYVERKAAAVAAKVSYRTLRDTLLTTMTDTVLVKQVIARADTTIVRDSVALAAAEQVIAAKDNELQIALKPHPIPRLRTSIAALYEPMTARYSASADASFRVIGGWALLARVRAPVGERPQIDIGVALAFQ